jgi:hypothetical protein
MKIDLRTALVGSDRERSLQGVLLAAGVSALVLVISFLPLTAGAIVEPGIDCILMYMGDGIPLASAPF